jgi:signal transduction histidine kinase
MEITKEVLEHFTKLMPKDTALYCVQADGLETLFLSENIPDLLGLSHEEYLRITQKDALDLTIPQDRPALRKVLADSLADGQPFEHYYRVFHKDKGFDWVHVFAHVCGTREGHPVILAQFANMTREGGIYQEILNASDRGTVVVDRGTCEILYANEQIRYFSADTFQGLLNQKCHQLFWQSASPCENCKMQSGKTGEFCEHVKYVAARNSWVRITGIGLPWCGHDAYLMYFKDVTAEKEAEMEMARIQEMYADATMTAKLIVWTYDADKHRVTMMWNGYTREICEKLGVPQIVENVPESLLTFVFAEDREKFRKFYEEIEAGAPRAECVFRFKLPSQATMSYEHIVARTIYDVHGNVLSVYCCGQNITKQKREEERYAREMEDLRKAGRSDTANTLYAKMAQSGITEEYQRQQYEQAVSLVMEGNHSEYLAKGHYDLTDNKVLEYRKTWQHAMDVPLEISYDEAYGDLVALIMDERSKQEYLDLFDRKKLISRFYDGKNFFSMEYYRSGKGCDMKWVRLDIRTFRGPVSGNVECFIYQYDVTEKYLRSLISNDLRNLGYEYVGIIAWRRRQALYFELSRNDGAMNVRDEVTDYDEYIRRRVDEEIPAENRAKMTELFSIERIVDELKTRSVYTFSYDMLGPDGQRMRKAVHYRYADDTRETLYVLCSDITEQYLEEQRQIDKVRQAKWEADRANEAKSAFLSGMSHDMRTPLNAILGFSDIALKEADFDKKQDYINKIRTSGELMRDLINDTLDLSRIESGKVTLEPEEVDSRELVQTLMTALQPVAEAKGLCLQMDLTGIAEDIVWIDKLKLQKIFLNLLSNAIKYTPKGGNISCSIHKIESAKGRRQYRIVVEDTGIGMSPDFLPRLYEPFAQEHRQEAGNVVGTGLGLSIVKQFVDLMGGDIRVRSTVGVGTCFTVDLPIQTVEAGRTAKQTVHANLASLSGRRILLCEDNYLNREIAAILLHEQGVIVECAENGQEGAEKVEHSPLHYYDAVLMDIRMPVMDGYEAARRIRALPRPDVAALPILALSANAFEEDIRQAEQAGMNGYVVKPIEPLKLFAELTRLIVGET